LCVAKEFFHNLRSLALGTQAKLWLVPDATLIYFCQINCEMHGLINSFEGARPFCRAVHGHKKTGLLAPEEGILAPALANDKPRSVHPEIFSP